jgi:hypothetical protein
MKKPLQSIGVPQFSFTPQKDSLILNIPEQQLPKHLCPRIRILLQ